MVENSGGRPIGCATLLSVKDHCFNIAPIEVVNQTGSRLIEWRELDGQKFERIVLANFEVLSKEPSLKLAVLRFLGTTAKRPLKIANTRAREFYVGFAAYSSRPSHPKPIEAISLKVSGLTSARAAHKLSPADFFQVESGLDFKLLGSPLVTQQGELAAIAFVNIWNSTLYCPADSIIEHLPNGAVLGTNTQ